MASNVVSCPQCNVKNRLGIGGASKLPRCGRCGAPLPWLVDASDASFDREAAAPTPVLVDLWAPWCGPCRTVAPILEELSRDMAGRLKLVKVNVDENPEIAARFQARSIPMLVLLKDGEVRETIVGAHPKAALRRLVESCG